MDSYLPMMMLQRDRAGLPNPEAGLNSSSANPMASGIMAGQDIANNKTLGQMNNLRLQQAQQQIQQDQALQGAIKAVASGNSAAVSQLPPQLRTQATATVVTQQNQATAAQLQQIQMAVKPYPTVEGYMANRGNLQKQFPTNAFPSFASQQDYDQYRDVQSSNVSSVKVTADSLAGKYQLMQDPNTSPELKAALNKSISAELQTQQETLLKTRAETKAAVMRGASYESISALNTSRIGTTTKPVNYGMFYTAVNAAVTTSPQLKELTGPTKDPDTGKITSTGDQGLASGWISLKATDYMKPNAQTGSPGLSETDAVKQATADATNQILVSGTLNPRGYSPAQSSAQQPARHFMATAIPPAQITMMQGNLAAATKFYNQYGALPATVLQYWKQQGMPKQ